MNRERSYTDFNRLDPRLFKAFLAAADCENFTLAAKKSAMTQSGISQQIAKLEAQIGLPLFNRINRAVTLSDTGKRLVSYINSYLEQMDSFFNDVAESEFQYKGLVSYAMPGSCLLSPHLEQMLQRRTHSPAIDLKIDIDSNENIYNKVLDGDVDFGFVTNRKNNPAIEHVSFCKEEFSLVGGVKYKNLIVDSNSLKSENFIGFPGLEDYLNPWLKTYFPRSRNLSYEFLQIKARISQLHGVTSLLKQNVGMTFIPTHCVQNEIDSKEIYVINKGLPKKNVLNDIYIIHLKNGCITRRCRKVIDWFLEMRDS